MKKTLKLILPILLLLAGVFAFGPRPETNNMITFDASTLGENLDDYLHSNEAKVPNLVDGAGKEIIWADPVTKAQTNIAIVYVHGFSATKQEIRPVPDTAALALEANIYYARLAGHGRDGDAMAEATTTDWANDLAEAVAIGERLGKRLLIISTSTGATLSTWAASKPELSKNIAGMVMISPNFELHGIPTSVANLPWMDKLLPILTGSTRSWDPLNEEHGKWWTNSYPLKAIFPMTSYLKILKDIDKSEIKIPTLFIYSPKDQVVVVSEIEMVARQWGGETELMKLTTETDPYQHVITGDIVSPKNTQIVSEAIIKWSQGL